MSRLTVLGTGIMFPNQMTMEASEAIRAADIVYFNVGVHPLATRWIKDNARQAVDLYDFYDQDKERSESYEEMVSAIVSGVESGKNVVAAFYGHPGVFVGPGFTAMQRCRDLGFDAKMLPGVSAADCMIADLEFDPAVYGCTMIEATDYVWRRRTFDPSVPLMLWQSGVVGQMYFDRSGVNDNLDILKARLLEDFPPDHTIISYIAATIPEMRPVVKVSTVGEVVKMGLNASHTCLLPPLRSAGLDRKYWRMMKERLGA